MDIGCARAEELTPRGISGNASPEEAQGLKQHLAGCAACSEKNARARRVWALMGRLPNRTSSELRLQETVARARRPAFRPAWAVAAAAAALLAVIGTIVFRGPSPERVKTVDAPPPVEIAPSPEPEPLQAKEERNRVVETLEAINREKEEKPAPAEVVPPAPEPKAPVAEVRPKPEQPVVRAPETPKPETPAAAPEPKPAPAPQVPARETLPTAATIDRVQGEVYALVGGARVAARADFRLVADEGLETVGKGSQAVLEYHDGTRVVLGADTLLSRVTDHAAGTPAQGKRITVERGVVAAQVAKQPAAGPMIFATPHAEARVLGTRLSLHVTPASTRCEVKEGRVRFSRLEGGSVELNADQFAVAGKGIALSVKSAPSPKIVLRETFDRGRWQPVWSQESDPGSGLKLAVKDGSLSLQFGAKPTPNVSADSLAPNTPDATKKAIDQVARVAALGSKKDWPRSAALEIKQPFALSNETPLRLRAKLWQAQSDGHRIVAIALNRAVPAHGLSLERRGGLVQLWSEGTQTALWKKDLPCAQEWETLELWISKDRVAVRRDGLTLFAGANPVKARTVQVSLGGHARLELAQDGETRFDDVEISWMTKLDLEEISR